jgi:BON domain
MPTPLELLTKPLQIGAQIAFGAIQNIQRAVQGLTGGEEPPPRPEPPQPPQTTRAKPRPKQLDDTTITRKVETILFRDESVAKGKISVNTADGVVTLRGEAKTPEQIKKLEAKAQAIPEVKGVENLLHLPKTAPSQKKTRQATRTGAARKRAPKRTTAERKTSAAAAEPAPKDLAEKGEGRRPAPLGASDA